MTDEDFANECARIYGTAARMFTPEAWASYCRLIRAKLGPDDATDEERLAAIAESKRVADEVEADFRPKPYRL